MPNTDALKAWLRWCEANPVRWQLDRYEIPLAEVDMTFDQVQEVFDRPTLADVREAVEQVCAEETRRRDAEYDAALGRLQAKGYLTPKTPKDGA